MRSLKCFFVVAILTILIANALFIDTSNLNDSSEDLQNERFQEYNANEKVTYQGRSQSYLPTVISVDTTLDLSGSPYIAENTTVQNGVNLTILAGVVILFNHSCSLTVNGRIKAQGSIASPIVFAANEDSWDGIKLSGLEGSFFDRVTFSDAKCAITIQASNVRISNCTFIGGENSISASLVNKITIENCRSNGTTTSSFLFQLCGDIQIVNCKSFDNDYFIYLSGCNNVEIIQNEALNTTYDCVHAEMSSFSVKSCKFSFCENGIYAVSCFESSIENNIIFQAKSCIYLSLSNKFAIRNNIVNDSEYGIILKTSTECKLEYNNASENVNDGILLFSSSVRNTVANCSAISNGLGNASGGISIIDSENNTLYANYVKGNRVGVIINNSANAIIEKMVIENNGLGIDIPYSYSVWINSTNISEVVSINTTHSNPIVCNSSISGKVLVGPQSILTFVDTKYDKNSLRFSDITSRFTALWSLTVLIVDTSGLPLSGYTVHINDTNSLSIPGSPFITGPNGITGSHSCIEYSSIDTSGDGLDLDVGERSYATPHKIEVDFAVKQSVEVTMNRTIFLAISPNGEFHNVTMKSPANNSAIHSGTPVYFSTIGDYTSLIARVTKGGSTIYINTYRSPFYLNTTDWTEGVHVIEIEMFRFGSSLGKWTFNLVIDNTPPLVVLTSPPSLNCVVLGTKATFSISDERLDYSIYYIDSVVYPFVPPYEISFDTIGIHTLTIESLDTAGNVAHIEYNVNVTSQIHISLTSPNNGSTISAGTTISLSVSNATYVRFCLDSNSWQTISSPYSISTSTWQVGTHILKVLAGNSCSEVYETYTFTIAGDNYPPVITSSPSRTVIALQNYRYEIYAYDPEGGQVYFQLEQAPAGMVLSGRNLTWTPTVMQIGLNNVTIIATDGSKVTNQSFFIFVFSPETGTDTIPTFSSTPRTYAYLGVQYTYDANASDTENDALMYVLLECPQGMEINYSTGRIDWRPSKDNLGENLYVTTHVSIGVTDGRSWIYQNYTLTLYSRPNSKPVILGEFKKFKFTNEKKISLSGRASDSDDKLSNLTWSVIIQSNKILVSIDVVKNLLIIKSTGKGLGKANFTLILTDSFGANDSRRIDVEVISAQGSDLWIYGLLSVIIILAVIFLVIFLFKRELFDAFLDRLNIKKKKEIIYLGRLVPESSESPQQDIQYIQSYQPLGENQTLQSQYYAQEDAAQLPTQGSTQAYTTQAYTQTYTEAQAQPQTRRGGIKVRPLAKVPEEYRLKYEKLESDFSACEKMGIDVSSAKTSLEAAKESVTTGQGYKDAIKKCSDDFKLALKKAVPIIIRQFEKKIEEEEKALKDTTAAKDAVDKIETDFAGANYDRIVESIKIAYAKIEKLKEMSPKMVTTTQTTTISETKPEPTKPETKLKSERASLSEQKSFAINLDGRCYLVNETECKNSHEALRGLLDSGAHAIWVTRTPKDKLVQLYKIPSEDVQIFELFGVDSSDPKFILKTLQGYVSLGGKRAMLFDCLLYLLVRTNVATVSKLLSDLTNAMKGKETCCIIPLDFKVIDPNDLKEVEKNAVRIDDPSQVSKPKQPEKTPSGPIIRCHICMGLVKPGLPLKKCDCGKKFHESCANRVGICPNCGRQL